MALVRTSLEGLFGRRSESGTAAIEFALFLPFLLLLLTGTVELGFSAYEAMQVNNAVEAGALYAAKNGWNSASIASATVAGAVIAAGIEHADGHTGADPVLRLSECGREHLKPWAA